MNQARFCHASCGFKNDAVLVFMGIGEENTDLNSIERWTLGTTQWKMLHISGYDLQPTNCLRAV